MAKYRIETEKGVYEVETEDAPKPQKTFFQGVKETLIPQESENQRAIRENMQAGNYGKAALGTIREAAYENTPLAALVNMARGSKQKVGEAITAAKQGQYKEAALRGAEAIPILGPGVVEPAENIANPETRSYGLGQAAATIAPMLAGKVIPKLVPASAGTQRAAALDAAAAKNYERALQPTTTPNKVIVRDVVAPGLRDRGVVASSLEDLNKRADMEMRTYRGRIDDFFDQKATEGATMPAADILNVIQDAKNEVTHSGGTVLSVDRTYASQLNELRKDIRRIANANGGQIPLAEWRKVRQSYDKFVDESHGFAVPPSDRSKVQAVKKVGDAIRGQFADKYPELAKDNKEFNFWKHVDDQSDATSLRRTGQRPTLAQHAAEAVMVTAAAKLSAGNPLAILGAKATAGKLVRLQNGMLWNSVSAQTKARVANLAREGRLQDALSVANQAVVGAVGQNALSERIEPPVSVPE